MQTKGITTKLRDSFYIAEKMTRKPSPFVIVATIFACILLIFFISRTSLFSFPSRPGTVKASIENSTIKIADILKVERKRYMDGLRGYYHFTEKKVGLASLTPETNGRPIQSCKCSFYVDL